MKHLLMALTLSFPAAWLVFLSSFASCAEMTPEMLAKARQSVVWMNGCSGVIIRGGFVVTAEHCGQGQSTKGVMHDGTSLILSRAHEPEKNNRDEATIYKIIGSTPRVYSTVAMDDPSKGEQVTSIGFPNGKLQINQGKIKTTTSDGKYICDFWAWHGNSGGPLYNSRGELIGICSARSDTPDEYESYWIPLKSIHAGLEHVSSQVAVDTQSRQVVVFSSTNCIPCQRLKEDVRSGYFRQFDVVIYEWDGQKWDSPQAETAYGEFIHLNNLRQEDVGFPVTWVKGTTKYKVGYGPAESTSGRRGLLGLLVGFFRDVAGGIGLIFFGTTGDDQIGGQPAPPPQFGNPGSDPAPAPGQAPPPPEEGVDPAPVPESFKGSGELKDRLSKLEGDLDALRNGGIVDRVKAVAALKGDLVELRATTESARILDQGEIADIKGRIERVKSGLEMVQSANPLEKIKGVVALKSELKEAKDDISKIKKGTEEDPWLWLLGLVGTISGLLHRRYAA